MAKLVLSVPDGKYCWDPTTTKICNYFNNEGGYARCDIFNVDLHDDEKGRYHRPDVCHAKLCVSR